MDKPYIGMAVLVHNSHDGLVFGHVEDIDFEDETITITGGDEEVQFYCRGPINHSNILYMKAHPHSIPQLIDIALDTGNQTDFMELTQFMIEWEEVVGLAEIKFFDTKEEIT